MTLEIVKNDNRGWIKTQDFSTFSMCLHGFIGTLMMFIFFTLTAFGSESLTIDSFEYKQNQTAQNAWMPQKENLPVKLTSNIFENQFGQAKQERPKNSDHQLLLRCDFSRKKERCYWDRELKLDLTKFGRFSLWVCAKEPQAVRNGTIYLKSGDGWFAGSFPVEKKEMHQVSLWKSDFKIEGSPEGWNSIEKIRLSFWKANNTNTTVIVDNFEVFADEIIVVLGDLTMRHKSTQAKSVRKFCNSMTKMLENLNLNFSVVTDTDVEAGALSGCKLALFPYNPDISQRECQAVKKFVQSGGKFMLFYSLPEQLAELLGIENTEWMSEEYPGQFYSIQLKSDFAEGLPKVIRQGSWNVRIPKARDLGTEMIGEWVDIKGKNTEIPAITLNSNGVFMGHVLLPGDELEKKQMLLALIGKLLPSMRQDISRATLKSVGKIAGFESFDETSQFITNNTAKISKVRKSKTLKHLAESKRLLAKAGRKSVDKQYGETLMISRKAMQELQEAFFYSFPSRKEEFRAFWCHSAFGIPGWSWDKAIRRLKENGFNTIVPNMLWAGVAYYPSEILPVAEEVKEKGDQMEQCVRACKKYGVKIHVWKVNWNLSRAPEKFVKRMRREGRLQKDRWGKEVKWLCPSNPKNFKLELESMLEIVRKYDVDGIHFDYIRYPHENACYCAGCRERFEKSRGVEIEDWPEEVINGVYAEDFAQWRREQITRLVQAVSENARKINPKIEISAAVFRNYSRCRRTVGQDWKMWVESGYLDFVCPMDYTANNDHFKNLLIDQLEVVDKRVPVYPGIGASAPGLPSEQVAMQIHIARSLGVDGFIVFNYDLLTARKVLPDLHKGITVKTSR